MVCQLLGLLLLGFSSGAPTAAQLATQAEQLSARGQAAQGVKLYERAVELAPDDAVIRANLGVALAQMGQISAALPHLKRAAKLSPKDAQLRFNLGFAYMSARRMKKALKAFRAVLKIDPTTREAHLKIASVLRDLGRLPETVSALQAAIALQPANPNAYGYLADTFNNLKRWPEAIALYEKQLAMPPPPGMPASHAKPFRADVLSNLADTLQNVGQHKEAAAAYRQSLLLSPQQGPRTGNTLAGLLAAQRELSDWNGAWEGVFPKLMAEVRGALTARAPSPLSPYGCLFLPVPPPLRLSIARSWQEGLRNQFGAEVAEVARVGGSPFAAMGSAMGSANGAHAATGAHAAATAAPPPQLRIGIISRRFHRYPGTQLMLRLFALLAAHPGAHVTAYAHGPDDGSEERRVVRASADAFADVAAEPPAVVAARIARDGIQVLVDYDGAHDFNNLAVLARRPAPVQVTWLGFAATTGCGKFFDYALVDSALVPPDMPNGLAQHADPPLLLMPHTYQPQDHLQDMGGTPDANDAAADDDEEVADDPDDPDDPDEPDADDESEADEQRKAKATARGAVKQRARSKGDSASAHGLPTMPLPVVCGGASADVGVGGVGGVGGGGGGGDGGDGGANAPFVFACFNRNDKIVPEAFAAWMDALRRMPRAVLWLYRGAKQQEAEDNLRREAAARGILPSRLVFARKLPKPAHLARHRFAGLFLDTSGHYGAHTTGSDALFAGLPVLSRGGATFASRVGASLLRAGGAALSTPLLATGAKDELSLTLRLAARPRVLRGLSSRLVAMRRFAVARGVEHGPGQAGDGGGGAPPPPPGDAALFDMRWFARSFVSAMRQAWESSRAEAGTKPSGGAGVRKRARHVAVSAGARPA